MELGKRTGILIASNYRDCEQVASRIFLFGEMTQVANACGNSQDKQT